MNIVFACQFESYMSGERRYLLKELYSDIKSLFNKFF